MVTKRGRLYVLQHRRKLPHDEEWANSNPSAFAPKYNPDDDISPRVDAVGQRGWTSPGTARRFLHHAQTTQWNQDYEFRLVLIEYSVRSTPLSLPKRRRSKQGRVMPNDGKITLEESKEPK